MTVPQRATPDRPWPLYGIAATQRIEAQAALQLAPHTLMQRAGLAVARLALAVAPHAQQVWIACGPGNNGGDGLEAAAQLKRWGKDPVVAWLGDEGTASADTLASLYNARSAGVVFSDRAPGDAGLVIDALLGIGSRPLDRTMAQWVDTVNACGAPVLSVDLPSGLDADTGSGRSVRATHTLGLLTLKPGLFTAGGRDACGQVWLDDLAVVHGEPGSAMLAGPPAPATRLHASHKGSHGDVAVVGGAPGMAGAAVLAASAALHGGAGRVFLALLDDAAQFMDVHQPELMLRPWNSLDFSVMHVACGCGGGEAVHALLPKVISTSRSLVLDADALNAVATDSQLAALLKARVRRFGASTVLTPHPLEAARLLGITTAAVQADRMACARELAERFGCAVLLKGSGTVIAAPGAVPVINPTGNGLLATAGTGDVLAGLVAARLATGLPAFDAATSAAYAHGRAADNWPLGQPLVASKLAQSLTFE